MSAGDVVGEMALIDGHRRSATVVAETAVEGVILYRTGFLKLLDANPSISRSCCWRRPLEPVKWTRSSAFSADPIGRSPGIR